MTPAAALIGLALMAPLGHTLAVAGYLAKETKERLTDGRKFLPIMSKIPKGCYLNRWNQVVCPRIIVPHL